MRHVHILLLESNFTKTITLMRTIAIVGVAAPKFIPVSSTQNLTAAAQTEHAQNVEGIGSVNATARKLQLAIAVLHCQHMVTIMENNTVKQHIHTAITNDVQGVTV